MMTATHIKKRKRHRYRFLGAMETHRPSRRAYSALRSQHLLTSGVLDGCFGFWFLVFQVVALVWIVGKLGDFLISQFSRILLIERIRLWV